MVSGLLVPGSVRVVCDLVKSDPPESLLVSINDCLTKKLFSKEKMFAEIERRPGMKNRNLLKRLLRFATENCQSPLETIAWLDIYKAGLAMPEQQVVFRNSSGDFVGRVDMYWELPKKKLVLELDGHVKYEKRQDVIKEKKREDALRALGLDVIRADWQAVKSGDLIQWLIEKGVKPRRHFKGTFPDE
jgi:very-short-patch-repair endonuclease